MSTCWPNLSEYTVAVQNPKLAFEDKDLRDAVVTKTAEETPRVATGMYAGVYEFQRGEKSWAVRCFQHQVSDQHRRYDLLCKHLSGLSTNGFLVEFKYLENGIRHNQSWYPIVKMDWVHGCSLQVAVSKMIDYPDDLLELAKNLRFLVSTLRDLNMAHGDLEHGNILVTQCNKLKLVDYDGMFVPSMKGEKAPELGHLNFAHPRRNEMCFDETLDNFPAIVIFLSLRALASDRTLWKRYNNGDNLLFVESDYKNPFESPLFRELIGSQDPVVSKLTNKVQQLCQVELREIPCLENFLNDSKDGLFPSEVLEKRKVPITAKMSDHRADDLLPGKSEKEESPIYRDPKANEGKSAPSKKESRRDPEIQQPPMPGASTAPQPTPTVASIAPQPTPTVAGTAQPTTMPSASTAPQPTPTVAGTAPQRTMSGASTAPIGPRLWIKSFLILILTVGFLSAMIGGRLLKKAEEKRVEAARLKKENENVKLRLDAETARKATEEAVRLKKEKEEEQLRLDAEIARQATEEAARQVALAAETKKQQQQELLIKNEQKRLLKESEDKRVEALRLQEEEATRKTKEMAARQAAIIAAQEVATNEATRRRAEEDGFYIIKMGESLDSVAKKLAFLVSDLQKANDFDGRQIVAGQKLLIPEYRTYIARQGETIDAVAARFGLTKVGLKSFNNLVEDRLSEGKELRIPVKSKR